MTLDPRAAVRIHVRAVLFTVAAVLLVAALVREKAHSDHDVYESGVPFVAPVVAPVPAGYFHAARAGSR